MHNLSYIIWNFSPEIFSIGTFSLRWYGVMFALGFLFSQQILYYIYKQEGLETKDVDTLTIYMVIATVVGARLGHVLFYEPGRYFSHPIQILKIWEGGLASHGAAVGILFAVWLYANYDISWGKKAKLDDLGGEVKGEGKVKAKNGFRIVKRVKPGQSYLQVLDRIVILVALAGAFIRFGNFFNSEIIGKPTGSKYGVFFAHEVTDAIRTAANDRHLDVEDVQYAKQDTATDVRGYYPIKILISYGKGNYTDRQIEQHLRESVTYLNFWIQNDDAHQEIRPGFFKYSFIKDKDGQYGAVVKTYAIPRYPAQLYESASCVILFLVLFAIWYKHKAELPPGRLLGIFLIVCFTFRFLDEFLKENQVAFESSLPLNMGQILSIPLVIIGIIILNLSFRKKSTPNADEGHR